ncbi:guanylate kinase [Gonapodya prolifera JEL478]|uniref:Guanylate kinase n=1 Tax=Gonapodya prolifera (strain JEL478) TaxID=1344416 RepID=A0A139A6X7_GONPJ|nr:guanylate kinase [Gonapodya prolifera JEL478]|eukprot:KXS12093.1 guanylate kinase [Gonapodya prolifera JEL478]
MASQAGHVAGASVADAGVAKDGVAATEHKPPLVLSGPSGCGKSTLLKLLFDRYPNRFGFSVSHTTRSPRPGETPDVSYHYVSPDLFQSLVDADAFIEHATFSGNRYGTSKAAVQRVFDKGRICVLDIDLQGVKSVKERGLGAKFVFVKPPSMEILETRLRSRGTETESAIQARLAASRAELEYAAQPGAHDLVLVNDNLERALGELVAFIEGVYGALKGGEAVVLDD